MLYIKYMGQLKERAIPDAIKRLRLCTSLRDCGHPVEYCFKLSSGKIMYVYDDDSLGYSDWNEIIDSNAIPRSFIMRNDNEIEIVLLPLDNRIISGPNITKGGVNDCAILTDRELSFIEFKTNVTSNSGKNIEARTNEAINQLWHTFKEIIYPRCQKKGITLERKINVDFFIVFDSSLDVTNVIASRLEKQVEFLEEHGFSLFFNNEKSFT